MPIKDRKKSFERSGLRISKSSAISSDPNNISAQMTCQILLEMKLEIMEMFNDFWHEKTPENKDEIQGKYIDLFDEITTGILNKY